MYKSSKLLFFGYIRQISVPAIRVPVPDDLIILMLSYWYYSLSNIVNKSERERVFKQKLKHCSVIYDEINDSNKSQQQMKCQDLKELVEYASTSKVCFSKQFMPLIMQMVSLNLFRSFPPSNYSAFDPKKEEQTLYPSWSYLQHIYEFFELFLNIADKETFKYCHINKRFVTQLIALLDSEDIREREFIKCIVHKLYIKRCRFRTFIRKTMINNILYPAIYLDQRHNGIADTLHIFHKIIDGVCIPVNVSAKCWLRNVLIPLYKVSFLWQFHVELRQCITMFIQKERSLAIEVIGGLLRFWPKQSTRKEILFLNEVEQILCLSLTFECDLEPFIHPLFGRIALSICSPHFQVSETAICLWQNEMIATFTYDHKYSIFPLIYAALIQNEAKHWNSMTQSLTFNFIRIFKQMDRKLCAQIEFEVQTIIA